VNYLETIFQIWSELYDKNKDTKSTIEKFFHDDYTQCINGVTMDRTEYIEHVIEQKKNIEAMKFSKHTHIGQGDELFIIYDAKGKNIEGNDVEAEIISYFKFKENKVFRIHGQVHLLKGSSSDVDMNN
jgi:hypothetical protein